MSDSRTPKKKRVRRVGEHLSDAERLDAQATFLEAFARDAIVSGACDKAFIARSTVYKWRDEDPAFAAAWTEAEAEANDRLTREIHRRAVTGWLEPVFQGGVEVGRVRKYDSTLLIFLKKARDPQFRDKVQVEQSGRIAVQHELPDDPELAAHARALLMGISGGTSNTGGAGVSRE